MKNTAAVHDNRSPGHDVTVGRTEENPRVHQIVRRLQSLNGPFFELQFGHWQE